MTFWMVLLVPFLFQEPSDELRKEIDKLKKQNIELQERVSLMEQTAIEDAQTIQRLRQVVKLLEGSTPADSSPSPSSPRNGNPSMKPVQGPVKPVKGRLVYVDAKNNFVTLGIGKKEGVSEGYRFEIYRETYENGGESKLTRLGIGDFEKYMGQDSMSKLIITEGTIAEMKPDDMAVAIRKLGPIEPSKESTKEVAPPPSAEAAKDGVYAITGRAGTASNSGYVINFASPQGAKQTQLVYCYRDGKFKAKLRLDKVEKTYSVGAIVDGTMESPPEQGDQVYLREVNKGLTGKVALSDPKNDRIAVDLRQRDGIKAGMHCEVRRLGQKVGTIMITEVQSWGSWAKPDGDLKIDQIQKGDFVEAVEEK